MTLFALYIFVTTIWNDCSTDVLRSLKGGVSNYSGHSSCLASFTHGALYHRDLRNLRLFPVVVWALNPLGTSDGETNLHEHFTKNLYIVFLAMLHFVYRMPIIYVHF